LAKSFQGGEFPTNLGNLRGKPGGLKKFGELEEGSRFRPLKGPFGEGGGAALGNLRGARRGAAVG